MDTLHQNLEHLYKSSLFNYIAYGGIITIDESDVCAKVKKADIVYHGQVLKIDNVFLKGCHTIYDDIVVGNPELKHDCDGILFISNAHGKYFVLIELKSKYTEDNITKAEKQLAASYVRVLSHLLCIEGFNIDDYIEIENYSGTVEEIGIFYTTLRTPDNKIVYVPNGELANNEIVNYNKKSTRRIDKTISISYDSDVEYVKKLINEVCMKNELILKSTLPFIKVNEYGDSAIVLLIRVWVKSTDYFSVFYDLLDQIKTEFDNNNIKVPYQQIDVHISK